MLKHHNLCKLLVFFQFFLRLSLKTMSNIYKDFNCSVYVNEVFSFNFYYIELYVKYTDKIFK